MNKNNIAYIKLRCIKEGIDTSNLSIPYNFVTKHHIKDAQNKLQDIILDDGLRKTVVEIANRDISCLTLKYLGSELKLIDKRKNNILPVNVYPIQKPDWWYKSVNNIPINELIGLAGTDRLCIWLFKLCAYWLENKQCKFCGVSAARHRVTKYAPNILELGKKYEFNLEKWWYNWKKYGHLENIQEAFRIIFSENRLEPHTHILVTSGNLVNSNFPWEMAIDIGKHINKVIDLKTIDSHINLMPPKDLKLIDKVYNLGFRTLTFDLEVFDPKRFAKVCPGKSKYYGYKNMIKALKYAREVFDGFVGVEFVLGAEPIKSLLKGIRYFADLGISSNANILIPKPNAKWKNKMPPSEKEIIRFYQSLGKILRYHRLKPLYCQMSLRTSLANEAFMKWL